MDFLKLNMHAELIAVVKFTIFFFSLLNHGLNISGVSVPWLEV